ncbi:MAG: hypothetical protein ABUL77_02865 [Bacteroidota bacterium]
MAGLSSGVWPGRAFALLALGMLCLTPEAGCSDVRRTRNRGEDLFVGREPLKGTIRGHQAALPPEVIRCGNCHGAEIRGATDAAIAAPHLDRSWLLSQRERRGGPPSAYDVRVFCRLLRTGVDPAHVLVAREMPIYEVDDASCLLLWNFLTIEATRHGKS